MEKASVAHLPIHKVNIANISDADDMLAVEEPVEMRLEYGPDNNRIQKSICITMRTPGNDHELAVGFLFTEGIIHSANDVLEVKHEAFSDGNIVIVTLRHSAQPDVSKLERHFYTSSSCGVCGKSSIDSVRTVCNISMLPDNLQFSSALIYQLPQLLRDQQNVFESTGGIHASALFDTTGKLLLTREDVGRHNALDKLIGTALNEGLTPLSNYLLLLSGRASFELIQKAAMAGIKIVAAVGAPSSLAVSMAQDFGMTLIGFLRGERFNIYTGKQRIVIL
ncbi:MAG: formate dehydrogenase accessory sulfurtransferase FdhD [Bacteroidota bacterium]